MKFIIKFFLIVLICINSYGQEKIENRHVTKSKNSTPFGEPYIAVNPSNSSEIVIASMYTNEISYNNPYSYDISLFLTTNGGKNWKNQSLPKVANEIAKGDPWIVWGENGIIYCSYIAVIRNQEKSRLKVYVTYSSDVGANWSNPVEIFANTVASPDHPTIVYNHLNKKPLTIFATGGNGLASTQVASISYDLSNTETFTHGNAHTSNNNLGSGVRIDNKNFVFIQTKNLHELRSVSTSDFGKTFIESTITERCIPYGFPIMTSDNSNGIFKNRIYSVWSQKGDSGTQIFLSYSDDFGKKWSSHKQVSQNSGRINLMPTIKVNNKGHILVAWATSKSDAQLDCYNMNYAFSKDGGKLFKEMKLTPEKYCANTSKNGAVTQKWKIGGDYFGIDSDPKGNFHVAWADARTGIYQIWYAKVSID